MEIDMRKRDLDLLKNIKKQEQKQKLKEQENIKQEEVDNQAISFEAWWIEFSKSRNVRFQVKEILRVDFKSRGLKDVEKKEAFDKAAIQFGYR